MSSFINKFGGAVAGWASKGEDQARPQPQQAPNNAAYDLAEQIVKYDQKIEFKEQQIEEYLRKATACKAKGDVESATIFLRRKREAREDRTSKMAKRENLFQMIRALETIDDVLGYVNVIRANKKKLRDALALVDPGQLENEMDELDNMFSTVVEVRDIMDKSLVTETAADKEEYANEYAELSTDESQAMGNAYGSVMHQQPQYQQQNVYAGAGMWPQQQQPQQQQRQQQVAMPAASSSSATVLMSEPPSWTPASMAMSLPPSGSSSTTTTSTATIRQPIASMAYGLGGLE